MPPRLESATLRWTGCWAWSRRLAIALQEQVRQRGMCAAAQAPAPDPQSPQSPPHPSELASDLPLPVRPPWEGADRRKRPRGPPSTPVLPAGGPLAALISSLMARMRAWMMGLIQAGGFWGILFLAAYPNAFFDLCGICCGHIQMPFLKFFGATLLGKGVIKASRRGGRGSVGKGWSGEPPGWAGQEEAGARLATHLLRPLGERQARRRAPTLPPSPPHTRTRARARAHAGVWPDCILCCHLPPADPRAHLPTGRVGAGRAPFPAPARAHARTGAQHSVMWRGVVQRGVAQGCVVHGQRQLAAGGSRQQGRLPPPGSSVPPRRAAAQPARAPAAPRLGGPRGQAFVRASLGGGGGHPGGGRRRFSIRKPALRCPALLLAGPAQVRQRPDS